MKLLLIFTLAVSTALMGCASRSYVRRQTNPINDKVSELDQRTAQNSNDIKQNTNDIKQVDARAQAGIQDAKADAAAASQQANQAQAQSTAAAKRVDTLPNPDNYRVATEASVTFGDNKDDLTPAAKTQLDELVSRTSSVKDYIFVVKGYADSRGRKHYNYALSTNRADAVTDYLVAQRGVPTYKIFAVGLGENSPVDSNKTHAGRAKNRRVEIRLMMNTPEGATTASNQ
jgi:OOP family OmpA-OmpF porin